MKRIFCFLIGNIFLLTLGFAQVRTYSDNASKTFIVGLESYFYGESGALDFVCGSEAVHAALSVGTVSVGGTELSRGAADAVVGIHDFTEDRIPELVVARRLPEGLTATVYTLSGGTWRVIGQMAAPGAKEFRVFRQVVSARRGEALSSWTWHGTAFDFKASDGSPEPILP